MLLIFSSLIMVVLFGFLIIICLNYAVVLWESKKIDDLTSQIKSPNNDLLGKNNATRGFTSMDLGSNRHKSNISQVYERALVSLQSREYPSWLNRLFQEIEKLRKNFWLYLKTSFLYLISLTKSTDQTKNKIDSIKNDLEEKRKTEIDDLVEKVVSSNTKTVPEINTFIATESVQQYTNDSNSAHSNLKSATIDLVGQENAKEEKDMSLFEKMENRILAKLKDAGLNHYDIWLELGQLYEKYEQTPKAIEVYALVLKHSVGRDKEFARDKLISLS